MNLLKHLQLRTDAEKSEFVLKVNESLKGKTNLLGSAANSGGSSIVIPDIYTLCKYCATALTIKNNKNEEIFYWYTYDGSQKWYYKYDIGAKSSGWNWQWKDNFTHHCMIIELPIDDKQSYFVVPAVTHFQEEIFYEAGITAIYRQIGPRNNPPKFNNGNWELWLSNLWPGNMDLAFNYHATVDIMEDSTIEWNAPY